MEHHELHAAVQHCMEKVLDNIERMTEARPVTEEEQKKFAYHEFAWGSEKDTDLMYEFLELMIFSSLCKVIKGE